MNITEIRQRAIGHMRDAAWTTPPDWDRDCRCCLELQRHRVNSLKDPCNMFDVYKARTGRLDYHIRGGGFRVIVVGHEEIHADHTDEEITLFMAERE